VIRDNAAIDILWNSTATVNDGVEHSFDLHMTATGLVVKIDGAVDAGTFANGNSSTVAWFNDVTDLDFLAIGANEDSGGLEFYYDGIAFDLVIYDEDGTTVLFDFPLYENAIDVSGNNCNGVAINVDYPLIPALTDLTADAAGGTLQHQGVATPRAYADGNSCISFNGTNQSITAAHLVGTETIVSSGGTSTPSISAGSIAFTAGTAWDILLSDGTHYPLAEGAGVIAYNTGTGNHGTLTNSPTWSTQDVFAANFEFGFSLYEHATLDPIRVPYGENGSLLTITPPSGYTKTSDNPPILGHNDFEGNLDFVNTSVDRQPVPETARIDAITTADISAFTFGMSITSDDNVFYHAKDSVTNDRLTIYEADLAGADLAKLLKYTNDGGK
jgi:hypothetical protein